MELEYMKIMNLFTLKRYKIMENVFMLYIKKMAS